jgi:urease accessory protein
MLRLHGIIGNVGDAAIARRLHALEHRDAVEILYVTEADAGRHRLRLTTDRGTDCALIIERAQTLTDGAVVLMEPARAIVVRIGAPKTLTLRPDGIEAAIRLGWSAGNLHWRVTIRGHDLIIVLDGPQSDYLARIKPLLDAGSVTVAPDADLAHDHDA